MAAFKVQLIARRPRTVTRSPKRPFDEIRCQPTSSANQVTARQSLELALPTDQRQSSHASARLEADAQPSTAACTPAVRSSAAAAVAQVQPGAAKTPAATSGANLLRTSFERIFINSRGSSSPGLCALPELRNRCNPIGNGIRQDGAHQPTGAAPQRLLVRQLLGGPLERPMPA